MRTTLAIDDDVFSAVKGLASAQQQSMGAILSALARQALASGQTQPQLRHGIPLLAASGKRKPVTSELVNQLRDELQ